MDTMEDFIHFRTYTTPPAKAAMPAPDWMLVEMDRSHDGPTNITRHRNSCNLKSHWLEYRYRIDEVVATTTTATEATNKDHCSSSSFPRARSRSMDQSMSSSVEDPHPDDEGDFLPTRLLNSEDDRSKHQLPPVQSTSTTASSWDELDFTSKKRSTRKHAHFANSNHHASTTHSSCKKQRGTLVLRKSIFTPIKREPVLGLPEKAPGDPDDDDNDEDEVDEEDEDDSHKNQTIQWETSTTSSTNFFETTAASHGPQKKPNKRSFGTCTTASLTHLGDESTDHSVDSTGTTSNFRFTSFPASLPRIHQQQQQQHHHHHQHHAPNNISSLHGSYNEDEDFCCYSGDDNTAGDDSTVASSMFGTPVARLNFASAMLPLSTAPCYMPDSSTPSDPPASFASSLSSIAKNNISACDNEAHTESTAALTPSRGGGSNVLLDPDTPREVQVHFHLPNCSPIPGIPEGNESSIISRPMPDSHAFDGDDEDDDTTPHNSSTESQVPALPHLRPPPTPIRIPNWSNSIHRRPNQKKLTRSNSLLATKVLASDAATNDLFPEIMTLSGSFRIIGSPLGKGVFADVCKVQSKTDERYYALKCQRQAFRGRKDRDIALAEVRCMLILQKDPPFSPYLLRFFKAWQEDERIHVVTELCCKDTCRQLLDKHPMLPEGVIWKLVYDVASGLSHMHARKLVHNDIKPSNILLERNDGLGAICKIGDFGMTRSIDSNDDGQEGDQKYMAPELLQKSKLQASADLFSLGLTLYEAASELNVPSNGPLWRQLRNGHHIFHFPNDRSVELQDLIRRMMHPDGCQRPTAASILDLPKAQEAGTFYNRFLADYIGTVETDDHNMVDENDANVDGDENDDYHTPRNLRTICSPPPGKCIAASSFLFSSPQA